MQLFQVSGIGNQSQGNSHPSKRVALYIGNLTWVSREDKNSREGVDNALCAHYYFVVVGSRNLGFVLGLHWRCIAFVSVADELVVVLLKLYVVDFIACFFFYEYNCSSWKKKKN